MYLIFIVFNAFGVIFKEPLAKLRAWRCVSVFLFIVLSLARGFVSGFQVCSTVYVSM